MSTETTISLDARYIRDESVVARLVGQEFLLVPTRGNVAELNSIYILNETAGRMWELLDGQRSLREICDAIIDEFDVTREQVERDLTDFIAKLEEVKVVKAAA
jgi:GGDEF domain-containing protein